MENSYYSGFMKYNILRKSCYKCKFRRYHVADITIADFWGYKKLNPDLDTKSGMSLIVVNTSKGEMYLNSLKEKLDLNEMDNRFSDYAFSEKNYDAAYTLREKFFALYKLKDFEKAAKKTYFNNIFIQKLKYKIKKIFGKE